MVFAVDVLRQTDRVVGYSVLAAKANSANARGEPAFFIKCKRAEIGRILQISLDVHQLI
jgi:hypothetical protein